MKDLTIIFYTANKTPEPFGQKVRETLIEAVSDRYPMITVSQQPVYKPFMGNNIVLGRIGICVENLYRQVLIGAINADTEYVALCEDDCLYTASYFDSYRPPKDTFAYNQNKWTVLAWDRQPILSNKEHRCVLHQCIAPRKLLIESLEERFNANLPPEQIKMHFAEPGRYERWMAPWGVQIRKKMEFIAPEPNIIFCHVNAMDPLGKKKRHGEIRTVRCEPWGDATSIILKYIGREGWEDQKNA
jgi:hypothetical protein